MTARDRRLCAARSRRGERLPLWSSQHVYAKLYGQVNLGDFGFQSTGIHSVGVDWCRMSRATIDGTVSSWCLEYGRRARFVRGVFLVSGQYVNVRIPGQSISLHARGLQRQVRTS